MLSSSRTRSLCRTDPGLANNYFRNQPAGGPEHQYNGRGDWNLSEKHRLYARYTYWNVYQRPSVPFPPPARQGDVGSRYEWQTHQAVTGDNYVLSPTTIVSVRASFLRNTNSSIPGDFPVDLSKWGNGYVLAPEPTRRTGGAPNQYPGFLWRYRRFRPADRKKQRLRLISADLSEDAGPAHHKVWRRNARRPGEPLPTEPRRRLRLQQWIHLPESARVRKHGLRHGQFPAGIGREREHQSLPSDRECLALFGPIRHGYRSRSAGS